jgi:phage FluMu protein Com
MRTIARRWAGVLAATVTFVASFVAIPPAQALTLSGSDFDPGDIISDQQFFGGNSMSVAEIQTFLDKKVPRCGTFNKCLSVYTQDTFTREATSIHGNGVNPLCSRYVGATDETAAEIIYKAQQACDISAKVILVTLQKEQGLITNSNPTADKLKIAMGYACPDTAPCASKYFGFYNQVYSAASQFKRYTDPSSNFWASKPVGVRQPILYHPNAKCGTKRVRIDNAATHALYIYTPYTPNAAALANLRGTGDSCSSYGNSNFWEYYQYWFNAKANLTWDVTEYGAGVTGSWGALLDDSTCTATANSCEFEYESAVATWSINSDTRFASGVIATRYKAAGGVKGRLGPIVKSSETIDGGGNGNGARQKFVNGFVYRTPSNSTFIVLNDVQTYYGQRGGPAGSLGWPTGDAACADGRCAQNFSGGYVISDSNGTYRVLDGAIAEYLQANGGINSPWGQPLSDAETRTFGSYGSGRIQQFEQGTVYEKNGTAYLVADNLAAALEDVGGVTAVGWPLAEPVRADGVLSQLYSAGRVVKVGAATGVLVPTNTLRALRRAGGFAGYLGTPTSDATAYVGRDGFAGTKQNFEGGVMLFGATGAYAMPQSIWDVYRSKRGAKGKHGWPDSRASVRGSGWEQSFQRGSITIR